ncbi:MAG: hypothetical protein V3T14_12805 [Myxococcota bacterium]
MVSLLAAAAAILPPTPTLYPVPVLGGTPPAVLREPHAVAWDPVREWLWVADLGAGRIVAFDPSGKVMRWTRADRPRGIAISPDGTLHSIEAGRIVRRTRRLEILSVENSPTPSPSAIAVSPLGEVWLADADKGRVTRLGGSSARLRVRAPTGLAFDLSGTLWVADAAERVLYRLSGDEKVQRIELPASRFWMYAPLGLSSDGQGGIVVADGRGGALHRVDRSGLYATLDLSGIPLPEAVAATLPGIVIVSDRLAGVLHRVELDTGRIDAFEDPEPAPLTLGRPASIALDARGSDLFIADVGREELLRVDRTGRLLARRRVPGVLQLAADPQGGAWALTDRAELLRLGRNLEVVQRLKLPVRGTSLLVMRDFVHVTVPSQGLIVRLDREGRELARVRPGGPGPFLPHDLAAGPGSAVWVLDAIHGKVRLLDAGRTLARIDCSTRSLTSDRDGLLWLLDAESSEVIHYAADGTRLRRFPVDRALEAYDVVSLRMGPDGELWGADDAGRRIVRLVAGLAGLDAR